MRTAKKQGINLAGLLTILFIGLKLTGYITWSWVWVLCPVWIPYAIGISFLVFGAIVIAIASELE